MNESQIRIHSIALIHEKLYQSDDLSRISFDHYVRELARLIVDLIVDVEREVDITIDSDEIYMTINQAIPCGLILNELITNAYKHAFEEAGSGKIRVSMHRRGQQVRLQFEDNGTGVPDDLDFENPSSLGLKLIGTLCRQLEAEYHFDTGELGGLRFVLRFSLEPSL